ncbi:hypothetical protein AYO20_01553 [Fonsecaea nubica]|uniref:DUF1993 domain-containing protein n=1 Tax=Fonsecaea nubica TaxID=856822 RepID=A0A178DDT4_9EURO|nr:hypothetical protein AYO20_01553 [Fonsecaea nubica]OAL39235.1 hypothetical protein AYO20_01553 [Fonsecaea nubica]
MAPLNLYDTTVVAMIRTLRNLSSLLKKGEAFADAKGIPHSEILEARIAPDMHMLPFQIQTCSNTAKFVAVRVAGVQNVPWEDNEKTFDELQARITKTIDFLEAVKREDFEGKESGHEIELQGKKLDGLTYVNAFAVPNFYFHAVTAYDILRMKGVGIGKKDWLGVN